MKFLQITKDLLYQLLSGPRVRKGALEYDICIFKLDAIGDFILAIGAIRFLCNTYPRAQIALVVGNSVAKLAEREFPQVHVIALPDISPHYLLKILPKVFKLKKALSGFRFRRLICLRHSRSRNHDLVLSWIISSECWGLNNIQLLEETSSLSSYPFSHPASYLPKTPSSQICHELYAHTALLGSIVAPLEPLDLMPMFATFQSKEKNIAIVTPFGNDHIRDIPFPIILSSLDRINTLRPLFFITIISAPKDSERAIELSSKLKAAGIKNLTVPLTEMNLTEFVEAVSSAYIILTAETSTAHIATAFNKRTIIVIGGGHYGWFGPWQRGERQIWLSTRKDCYGCNWNCPYPRPICITDIPTSIAIRSIDQLLPMPTIS